MDRKIQELVAAIGQCQPGQHCAYHTKKRNNLALRLPTYYEDSASAFVKIQSNGPLREAVHAMEADFGLAGSWQLMGEQREWFLRRLSHIKTIDRERISFAILGMPGVTHLIETAKLLLSVWQDVKLELLVLERCIGPLVDIESFLREGGCCEGPRECATLIRPANISLISGPITYQLINCDIAVDCPLAVKSIDVVSSHLTFRFLNYQQADATTNRVAQSIRTGGHFLLAQDQMSYMQPDIVGFFKRCGLRAIDFRRSWNIYELTEEQRQAAARQEAITVENNTFLLDLVQERT